MYYDYEHLPKELQDRLNNIDTQKYAEEHKFEILKERILQEYNICPKCGGIGGEWRSCYHDDTEWHECNRCKGQKTYFDKGLMKYFGFFM
jgi:hypothetical protein